MIKKDMYLVGLHKDSFRPGKQAKIIGVKSVVPDGDLEPRICYHTLFDDGVEDFVPWSEVACENYKMQPFGEKLELEYSEGADGELNEDWIRTVRFCDSLVQNIEENKKYTATIPKVALKNFVQIMHGKLFEKGLTLSMDFTYRDNAYFGFDFKVKK